MFSERKVFLNTLKLYLLERTVLRQKSCNFEHGLETKNEFEKWPLITFFQCIEHDISAASNVRMSKGTFCRVEVQFVFPIAVIGVGISF